jgi:hypothetical protein
MSKSRKVTRQRVEQVSKAKGSSFVEALGAFIGTAVAAFLKGMMDT